MARYRRVRAGARYMLHPVPIDWEYSTHAGQIVRVVELSGCPRKHMSGTGHAHIETLDGRIIGMVCTNSLQPVRKRDTLREVRAIVRGFLDAADREEAGDIDTGDVLADIARVTHPNRMR